MTATDELRDMLDERGLEWTHGGMFHRTHWVIDGIHYVAFEQGGKLYLQSSMGPLTVEQAIAATLGAGTCKDVCSDVSEFTCSACGFNCDLTSWISLFDGDDGRHRHHHHGTPHYCPNCGRKVVDE